MEKEQRQASERKGIRFLKLNKETLRQLEPAELQKVAGGIVTNGGTSCLGHPCDTL